MPRPSILRSRFHPQAESPATRRLLVMERFVSKLARHDPASDKEPPPKWGGCLGRSPLLLFVGNGWSYKFPYAADTRATEIPRLLPVFQVLPPDFNSVTIFQMLSDDIKEACLQLRVLYRKHLWFLLPRQLRDWRIFLRRQDHQTGQAYLPFKMIRCQLPRAHYGQAQLIDHRR